MKLQRKMGSVTVLLTLPYYDAINFTIVDPIHKLLLGSAKTFFSLLKQDRLSSLDFASLQAAVDNFVVPAGIGRLPCKVESGFTNLKPVLDSKKYSSLWVLFAQACSLMCSRAITHSAIELADQLIIQYCRRFEGKFGRNKCYPNLHLHCHLKDCLLNYGPAMAFWLFGFERLNCILGSFHTNNQAVELQLFRS